MKFLPLLLTIAAFVGLGFAQGSMPVTPCTPTAPGTCNLGVAGIVQAEHTIYWWWLRIYNHNCQVIGGIDMTNGDQLQWNLPRSVYSQLPYSLELDYIHPSNYNYLAYRYGGFSFNGVPHCRRQSNVGPGYLVHMCQSAFPC
ncbi:hypothetical protein V8F06_011281 [Rhypophila decipiens]